VQNSNGKPLTTVNLRSLSFGTLAILLLAACGEGPTATLESASSVTVAPGGSTTLSVTLSRSNAPKGAFSLAIAGLPSGVSATFDPASAEADVERISLTFSATRDTGRGVAPLTLTATGPGADPLVATAPIELEVRGISVRGKVLAAGMGVPIPSAQVRVGESFAMTDTQGGFTVDDVALPYDLAVVTNDTYIETYPGLTAESPVVRSLFGSGGLETYSTDLTVELADPVPEDQAVNVCATGIDGAAFGCTTLWSGSTSSWIELHWTGTSQRRQVKLTAHAFSDVEQGATSILGFAESGPITVEHDVSSPAVTLALGAAPATSRSTLGFTLPDWAEGGGQLTLAPLNDDWFAVLETSMSGPVPVFQGAPQFVYVHGESRSGIAWRPSTSTRTAPLTFPSLPELISIPDDLSGDFVLSAPAPGELSVVGLFLNGRAVIVHTATDRFRLPDLTDLTGARPLELHGTFLLARGSNYASMDTAVTEDGVLSAITLLGSSVLPSFTSERAVTFSLMEP